MIGIFNPRPKFKPTEEFSELKPGQVKSSSSVDIDNDILEELFSSGDGPNVSFKGCDSCNQGGCLDCIRGYVEMGVGSKDEIIEFDRKAADIIKKSKLPIRITYESVYNKSSIQPGQDAKPIEHQVYIEMDSKLKPFIKNDVNVLKSRTRKFGAYRISKWGNQEK